MKNILPISIFALAFFGCGKADWRDYNLDFHAERHDDFILEELPYLDLHQMQDSVNIASLFQGIFTPEEMKSNQFFMHTYYTYQPTSFTIAINPTSNCGSQVYFFTVKGREIIERKKVAFRNCPMDGSETLDFKNTYFDEFHLRYFKKLKNQFISEQYTEKCKIDSIGTFSCEKVNHVSSVSLRDSLLIKREPKKRFKYIKKIPLGTKFYATGKYVTDTDSTLSRPYEYAQVLLENGKDGWVEKKYVIESALPATIISNAALYQKPNSKTPFEALIPMDIVAVMEKDTLNNRFKVTAKTFGIKKPKEGWISGDHFSLNELDVEYSRLVVGSDNLEKLNEALKSGKFQTVNEELKKASGLKF